MPLLRFTLLFSLLLSSFSFGQANLQIIRATYGDGDTVRDVTAAVQAKVQNNAALRVQAMPDSLGGDPVPGALKTLWVQYNFNGQTGEISAQDGAWIVLPTTGVLGRMPGTLGGVLGGNRRANQQQNQLTIISAQYGADPKWVDVKGILDSRIRNNALSTPVNNKSFGGDPVMGKQKTLRVSYSWQGQQYDVAVPEDGILNIPANQISGVPNRPNSARGGRISQLAILSAQYGAPAQPNSKDQASRVDRFTDVKPRLDSLIQNNTLQVLVNNASLGGIDPAPANKKLLRVNYTWNGQSYTAGADEGQTLIIPDANAQAQSPAGNASQPNSNAGGGFFSGIMAPPVGLRIIAATYGSSKKTSDVTKLLDSKIQNNALQVQADNQTMGGDPDVGADKTLRVIYEINGLRYQVVINEDKPLRIP